MRRLLIGLAAGMVLTLAAVSSVAAYWQGQVTVPAATVSSGDLSVTASWPAGTPTWPALYPGQSTPGATLRVNTVAEGTTLQWRLRIDATFSALAEGAATLEAWRGACGSGQLVPVDGIGPLEGSQPLDLCVRVTLAENATNTLQGLSLAPDITIVAEQVTP